MTDRELLEAAAKAAGISRLLWDYEYCRSRGHMAPPSSMWNPLTDDGDALRLAVKLNMDLMLSPNHGKWAKCVYGSRADESGYPEEDPYAATRRAIVRAAAEIGKNIT